MTLYIWFIVMQNLSNEEQVAIIHARTVLTLAEKVLCAHSVYSYFFHLFFSKVLCSVFFLPVARAHWDDKISITAENEGHREWEGKCIYYAKELLISFLFKSNLQNRRIIRILHEHEQIWIYKINWIIYFIYSFLKWSKAFWFSLSLCMAERISNRIFTPPSQRQT